MKKTLFTLCAIGNLIANAEEPDALRMMGAEFTDPRNIVTFFSWIEDGQEPEKTRSISNSLLIICWMQGEDRMPGRYQISGLDGDHTEEQVSRFLSAYYRQAPHTGNDLPNVIVAGNNWSAGIGLKPVLQELSKEKSFSVFYAGGWAFSKVRLIPEPEDRLKRIRAAYHEGNPDKRTRE